MEINRPLDYLNYCKGKEVVVRTTHKGDVSGVLKAFDLNINVSVEKAGQLEFVKGEQVIFVSLKD